MPRKKPSPIPATPAPASEAPPVTIAKTQVLAITRDGSRQGTPKMITPEGMELVRRWASEGASYQWIASQLGVDRSTFAEIRKRQPECEEALLAGKSMDEHAVACALRARALGPSGTGMDGDTVAMLFYLKAKHGWREGADRDGGTQVNVQIVQLPARAATVAEYEQSFPPPPAPPAKEGDEP